MAVILNARFYSRMIAHALLLIIIICLRGSFPLGRYHRTFISLSSHIQSAEFLSSLSFFLIIFFYYSEYTRRISGTLELGPSLFWPVLSKLVVVPGGALNISKSVVKSLTFLAKSMKVVLTESKLFKNFQSTILFWRYAWSSLFILLFSSRTEMAAANYDSAGLSLIMRPQQPHVHVKLK